MRTYFRWATLFQPTVGPVIEFRPLNNEDYLKIKFFSQNLENVYNRFPLR